jgi:hypothetical protein
VRCCERTIRRATDSGALRAGRIHAVDGKRGGFRICLADLDTWMYGMGRRRREPTIEVREHRCADRSVTEMWSVRSGVSRAATRPFRYQATRAGVRVPAAAGLLGERDGLKRRP